MMRTTISIHDSLFAKAKKVAGLRGLTLSQVVEDAVRDWLLREQKTPKPFRLRWEPVKGDRPPAVDIADRDRLYDFMEGRS